MPSQSEIDQEREPLPLPSLQKVINPYRLPIPLACCPREDNNDKKPLELKDPGSFIVNISIGGKETARAMLDLRESINIMRNLVYSRMGLGKLKPTPMTLQFMDESLNRPKGIVEDLMVQAEKLTLRCWR